MITKLLTSTVNIMQVILLLTAYSFLPVLFWLNFEFTGQLHFSQLFRLATNQMKYYFYNAQENLKDLNNMERTNH